MGAARPVRSHPTRSALGQERSPRLVENRFAERGERRALFSLGWWLTGVTIDDGSVSSTLMFEPHDFFDTGADGGGPALVHTACDEFIEVREELLR